jgi:hypothetical protein
MEYHLITEGCSVQGLNLKYDPQNEKFSHNCYSVCIKAEVLYYKEAMLIVMAKAKNDNNYTMREISPR